MASRSCEQGDVILVPFPFTDLSSQKTRPALVLSKADLGDDVIVAAITSRRSARSVSFREEDLKQGQLPVLSYIRVDKIVTLHKSLIRKQVAVISKEKMVVVLKTFHTLF